MKRIAICLVIFLLFLSVPVTQNTFAAGSTIENGDFESDSQMWKQGVFSENTPFSGVRCLQFGTQSVPGENGFLHTLSYVPGLSLSGSTVYAFTFYIRDASASQTTAEPTCTITMPENEHAIVFSVSNLTSRWEKISVPFMVDVRAVYTLSIQAETSEAETELYIDSVSLSPVPFSPEHLAIMGPHTATVPKAGVLSYKYAAAAADADGNVVMLRSAEIQAVSLPQGTVFDAATDTLYVEASAEAGSTAVLRCTNTGAAHAFPSIDIQVSISDNLLQNGTFSDLPLLKNWEDPSLVLCRHTADESYVQLSSTQTEDGTYMATLQPVQSFVLYADTFYAFRGGFRSSAGTEAVPIRSRATVSSENQITIEVSDIGGKLWLETVAGFSVPADGIYTLQIQVTSSDSRPLFADAFRLQPEEMAPAHVYFDLPMHAAVPKDKTLQIPLSPLVTDPLGDMCADAVSFSVSPAESGVTIAENALTIAADAVETEYVVTAFLPANPSVCMRRSISVSALSVGDGSFEASMPGSAWKTASPSVLQYVPTYNNTYPSDGQRMARLSLNGAVSALLSNSVYRYDAGKSYVFEADIRTILTDIPTVVTVLADNIHSDSFDDNLVIGQFLTSSSLTHIQTLFTPSETVTGQLMIAFNTPESHDQQVVLLDAISISMAVVSVSNVQIIGTPVAEKTLTGKYHFSSNFSAVDSSAFRWLISDSPSGIFMPLEGQLSNTISITEDMLGKCLRLEITPISLRGPVIGEIVISNPVRIGASVPSSSSPDAPPEVSYTPLPETPNVSLPAEVPASPKPTISRGGLRVLDLSKFTASTKYRFLDLSAHWAKDEIELLSAAGVIEGRGNGLFEPDACITRAEFSAFLARAFELAPLFYDNQFEDVKAYHWYAGVVAVVTKYEIAQGTGDMTFSPTLPITREEMAAMIMRAYRKANAQAVHGFASYADEENISPWAKADVLEASSLQLFGGFPDGQFLPRQTATRSEAAVTIKRMLSLLASTE